MDIMELGALGEAVGAIAVFVTLIYLAMGIRRNTASVDTARYDAITSGFNEISAAIVVDDRLARLFNLGLGDPDCLDPDDSARVAFLIRMFHNQYNKIFRLYRAGILSDEEWRVYAGQWAQFALSPGGARYLERNEDYPGMTEAARPYAGAGRWENSLDRHEEQPTGS